MTRHHAFKLLTLTSLLALPLGTIACSEGSSPTEPAFSDLDQPAVAGSAASATSDEGTGGTGGTAETGSGATLSSAIDESRGRGRGGDDNRGRGNRGRGGDDRGGDDRGGGGRGGDDDDDDRGRRGRGGDDDGGDNRGGRGRGGRDDDNRPNNNPNNPRPPRVGQEFEGAVASVGQGGLTLTNGTRIIVTGQTQWIARGDLHSLNQVAGAVAAGRPTRVEGRGTRQGNGAFLALTIKAETDD